MAAILFVSAAALLVICRFHLNSLAAGFLAGWLSRELNTRAAVAAVSLSPFRGRLSFRDFTLDQPPGFGAGPAFRVGRGSLRIRFSSLVFPPLVFEEIDLEEVEIRLVRNPAKKFNTGVFFPASAGSPDEEEPGGGGVLIRSGTARGIVCSYNDAAAPDGEAGVSLREGELAVGDLLIGEEFPGEGMEGRVILTAVLEQEGDLPAYLGLAGRTGGLGAEIPRLRAALRIFGMENATLEGFFPPPGPRIVGEEAFDLAADLRLSTQELDGTLTLTDWTGQAEGIEVRGRPERPEVELSAGLSLFLRHYGDRAGGWTERYTGKTGGRVVTTAVSTAAAAGEGLVHLFSSLGSGLFNFGKGVWRGAADHAARGAAEAGAGTARGAVKAVAGPGKALAEGTGLRRAVSGEGAADRWRYETEARWRRDWDEVRDGVE